MDYTRWSLRCAIEQQLHCQPAGADPEHTVYAQIALESGFSDQAHLTRECQRWFWHSPDKLRKKPQLTAQLAEPGLGNWAKQPKQS